MNETTGHQLRRLEPTESVSVAVAGELLNYLLSGQLAEGERLPSERELTEILGVGRSAVREALKPLALLGIVEIRQGSGTYFRGTTSELLPRVIEWSLLLGDRSVSELVEARATVEQAMARLAAKHRDDAQLARMAAAIETMSARDGETFSAADGQFHVCISEASQNRVLAGILSSIRELQRKWIETVVDHESDLDALFHLHEEIFAAIRDQDEERAERAMQAHMTWVTERFYSIITTQRDDEAALYLS